MATDHKDIADERDQLLRFSVAPGYVRGVHVSLDQSWQTVLSRIEYPEPVRRVLGEAVAASMMLITTLKFEGRLIMQIQGDGPLSMLVVQARSDRSFRALARFSGDVQDALLNELAGNGQLVLTLEPVRGERYQSLVPLAGQSLADALAVYFQQSEQLPTRFILAADDQRAVGLMVQKMPASTRGEQEAATEDWERVDALCATALPEEMLSLPAREMLYRLLHEETLQGLEQADLRFVCGCSRQKVGEMIVSIGAEAAQAALADEKAAGVIRVDCEFCGSRYEFDAVDVAQLFATEGNVQGGPEGRH